MRIHAWLTVLCLCACSVNSTRSIEQHEHVPPRSESNLAVKVGGQAIAFALPRTDGRSITLGPIKGTVFLLDFWATWCGPCRAAMPVMQKLHDEYAGKPFKVIGVNTWEQDASAAKTFMEKHGYTYPCVVGGDGLAQAYGITGIPTLLLINKDGTIALIEVGLNDALGSSLRSAIDAALAK
jgi:thiol-disulfide isomerase/thioredoxin